MRDEDHSVRVVATPDRVPPECLEPLRFYNCHDRVSDVAVFVRESRPRSKVARFHIIRGEILKTSTDAMIVSRADVLHWER